MHQSTDSTDSGKPTFQMKLPSLCSNVKSARTKALQKIPTFNEVKEILP